MPRRRPHRLDLKVGWSCNNRCTFCVQGDKRDRFADRDTETLFELIEGGRPDARDLVLTGGEPTIRRDLAALIHHARSVGYERVQLQTNGRMLCNEARLDALIDAGLTEVSPALHGPDPGVHDPLTRAPGSFKQTLRGIRNARARGLPVVLNSVVVRGNVRALPRMAELFVRLDLASFQFAFVHALGTAGDDIEGVMPRLSEAMPFLLRALAIGRAAGVPCWTEAVPLCFLPGFETHASERRIPRTRIVDADRVVPDYTLARRAHGKAKGPACECCALTAACEGPWKEYPATFGWEEFLPVVRPRARR